MRHSILTLFFMLWIIGPAKSETVTLFAASSTSSALEELKSTYESKTGDVLRLSYAASSTLARQISQGAPADLFLSANRQWVSFLEEQGLVVPNGRTDLLGNTLVLVRPIDGASPQTQDLVSAIDILLGDGRMAMGDPSHVPAGIYAKQALEQSGLWQRLKNRIAPTANVRAALALVERGEVPLGLVYGSDAARRKKVDVIYVFPKDPTYTIAYPLVAIKGGHQGATGRLIQFLRSSEAWKTFKRHGFILPQ